MTIQRKRVWVRLAVNKAAWKSKGNTELRWRVFIDPDATEILVRGVVLHGLATPKNVLTKWIPKPDERGVVAYIHYFCNIRVSNDMAYCMLLKP